MKRGEVWWANLPAPIGRRPVVLLSRDAAYLQRSLAIATPVTTRVRGLPTEVPLGPEDGLPRAYVANLDSLMTIRLSALQERIASLRGCEFFASGSLKHRDFVSGRPPRLVPKTDFFTSSQPTEA